MYVKENRAGKEKKGQESDKHEGIYFTRWRYEDDSNAVFSCVECCRPGGGPVSVLFAVQDLFVWSCLRCCCELYSQLGKNSSSVTQIVRCSPQSNFS